MRLAEFDILSNVDEMALSKYQRIGDFNKSGPFREPDRRLLSNPRVQLKTQDFFSNTNYNFRLFFSNIPGTGRYREAGVMRPSAIQEIFKKYADQILEDSANSITIVYVGNSGVDKVLLTPWMMAHRFGHAIGAGGDSTAWEEASKHFWSNINSILGYYRIDASIHARPPWNRTNSMNFTFTAQYNALFNAIGTQRSSKNNKINRPYEFIYELFAQYLNTGKITLNPLPEKFGYGKKAWGRPSRVAIISKEDSSLESRKQISDTLARDMQIFFGGVLGECEGKIYIM